MILFKIKSYIMPSKNVTGNMMLPVTFSSFYLLPNKALYTTNFTEPLSYQDSAFLKLPKFP